MKILDIVLVKPTIHGDDRGYFLETFRQDLFEDFIGKKVGFIQDNESKSNKGVLRGLHYQIPPYEQAKLVRVIKGSVLDVVVDIRKSSPTFGNSVAVELSDKNKHQLFIPKGFAHGFVVLSNEAIFAYKVDNVYRPEFEKGIIFNDKTLNIDWVLPKHELKLSDKDRELQEFKEL
ncbi:dTDP-4-dehydrorhamnose 3,5-epimerase [bacterium endosymbiont of Bathymodiolus sp. 5 South]|nr:dTDP-4-dehydrorhamnose 3,5-epimerase [bacterium endosymbiont of Bathymodiolus sp. 5 South]SSC07494.1 dTDP-4-dehydrorhamnose 3,5-epimerase [bacterium endosymbiont of Bathymodiolus sp. 5 South]VVH59049.1 dTDP-4-dehydrorhamnose 3,5-epimerase (EC [uncultured Gammaproteobacteria bacterium]VVH63665.1 dTDP-4-dehydrorhamnose 3,5-epimerase (EC [uncultured Gammaproteobacteria bacterium]